MKEDLLNFIHTNGLTDYVLGYIYGYLKVEDKKLIKQLDSDLRCNLSSFFNTEEL